MRRQGIIDALHAGGALVKYSDRYWSVMDRHGVLLSVGGYVQRQTALRIIREWPGGLHYRKTELYEEWRRKAGLATDAPEPPALMRGVCRL